MRFSIFNPSSLLALLTLLAFNSCQVAGDIVLSVEDLSVSMNENQAEGANIGQIKATANGAELNFEVISSSPEDAFDIDSRTGVLSIATPELFDYEKREVLTAQVRISAEDQSETVDIEVLLLDVEAPIEEWNKLTKTWAVENYTIGGNDSPCHMDDLLSISGIGKFTYDQGDMLCESADMVWNETGDWDLDENLHYILFDKGKESAIQLDLLEFGPERMVLGGLWSGEMITITFRSN